VSDLDAKPRGDESNSTAFVGCAIVVAIVVLSLGAACGLLWVVVRIVSHAWGGS
jgi:hypothetical protein